VDLPVKDVETAPGISEEEILRLVGLAQEGSADAFGRLFELLSPKLHQHAFFLTGDSNNAVDLLQETMIEVWKHLRRFDGRARLLTWICSIMAHRHYDWIRRWRVRATAVINPHAAESYAPSPEETVEQAETTRLLRECLDDLPAKQRTVVYLRFYAGESLEGIAAIAQCSVGTVKSRLFHGLERLARMRKLKEFHLHSGARR
jgi:RNA polymerase sigma-70 factor (ECF subfamily)